jgi:DNA polymerase III subunit epsilon
MTLYSIVDIETSGGSAKSDRITEIAIYLTDGIRVLDKFVSLINPECLIPYQITALTGITNHMLDDAPKFFEVARKIVEITENTVFVAHNASFDYSFIKREFERLGYKYKRETLCTVRLSRKLIPGYKSYSLGNLCENIGIQINNRHRAEGDVAATTELFHILLAKDQTNFEGKFISGFSLKGLNSKLDIEKVKALPEKFGVYYFYDSAGNLIYVGKSNNIKKRVYSHFNNEKTQRAIRMKSEIAEIGYEITGNELVALLLESEEIKAHKPCYNRAQRRTIHHYGLYAYYDDNSYLRFKIDKNSENKDLPLTSYSSKKLGNEHLAFWCKELGLCMKLCGLYDTAGACFYHSIGECKGACIGLENSVTYNARAKKLLSAYSYDQNDMLIVLNGKNEEELAAVLIQNGKYIGFAYFEESILNNIEIVIDSINQYSDNKDVQQIIRTYLKTKNDFRIVSLQ